MLQIHLEGKIDTQNFCMGQVRGTQFAQEMGRMGHQEIC